MPSLNPNIKVGYLDEDSTVNHPLLLGIHWSNLEGPQKGRDKLIDLQQADALADASMRSSSKMKHCSIHQSGFLGIKPSLRPIHLNVITKNIFVSMKYPCTASDYGAPFKMMSTDCSTRWWYYSWLNRTKCGVKAKGLVDAGFQVR